MLIYNIIIDNYFMAFKMLHDLVEIRPLIYHRSNIPPLMYWSGKSTTQSYIWKLKKWHLCIFVWPTRLPYHMIRMWFDSNTTGTTSGTYLFWAPEFILDLSWGTCNSIFGFLHVECFADHCLSLCSFSFGHCVACPSSILINPFSIFKLFLNACNYILLWIAIKDVHFRQFVWKL